jgi:hypothetical protein
MHMKRVRGLSQAWMAALFMGLLLTGCVGGGSDSTASQQGSVERSASLSWNAPLKREDGDPLKIGELSGFVISYGQDPENLTKTVRISEASTMEYTINNLADGTWYFTIQTQDTNGLRSEPSGQVGKTI